MKNISLDIDNGYTTTYVWPNNWDVNLRRYSNWAAVVNLNEEGEMVRNYLKLGDDSDIVWNVSAVKAGDIIEFGKRDRYKNRSNRGYFCVRSINDEEIVLLGEDGEDDDDAVPFTTIRKAMKANKN